MKVSIYIVDDEQMAIKYLDCLLEASGVDCQVVGRSTNVMKALPDIKRLKPDIIFTDISMPVMDGLEFSREILKYGSPKIFLLTAYRDFDYVKKGMQIGVTDYILKNELTEELLRDILTKAIADIMVERRKKHRILEYNVRNFLLSESGIMEGHVYDHRPMQRYALIMVKRPSRICLNYPPEQSLFRADCYELQNIPYPQGITCSAFTEMSSGEFCGIFFINSEVTDGQIPMEQAARAILDSFHAQNEPCICLISDTLHQFFELASSYRDLKRLAGFTYTAPSKTVFRASELRRSPKDLEERKSRIETFLDTFDLDSALEHELDIPAELQNLFSELRSHMDLWEYTEVFRRICHTLRSHIQKHQKNPLLLEMPEEFSSVSEAEETLLTCVRTLCSLQKTAASRNYSPYVQQAIGFIHQNYARDISIPDIAQAVNLSEGHLRRCFRQETDMKIVDYLTEYRLECAKHLMKNGEESLSEIWNKTGFTSAQYFSYVFKKKEGILPRDYMKQLKGK